eukprot:COSAG02_NODE_2364_length_9055_cov_12.230606_1_plen_76_part_00
MAAGARHRPLWLETYDEDDEVVPDCETVVAWLCPTLRLHLGVFDSECMTLEHSYSALVLFARIAHLFGKSRNTNE